MPRATWPLRLGCPTIRIVLTLAAGNQPLPCYLIADTGAGTVASGFDLLLPESDCLLCGGSLWSSVALGGAYAGSFSLYLLRVQIPELGFDSFLRVVGVPTPPTGFAGIASFCFLNQFTYGNFGNPGEFGLET
jgi:hypothetical protein